MSTVQEGLPRGAGSVEDTSRGPVRLDSVETAEELGLRLPAGKPGRWAKPGGSVKARKLHYFPSEGGPSLCGFHTEIDEGGATAKWGWCGGCNLPEPPFELEKWWARSGASRKDHLFSVSAERSECGQYERVPARLGSEDSSNKCGACTFGDRVTCTWCSGSFWGTEGSGTYCSEECVGHHENFKKAEKHLERYSDPTKLLSPDRQKAKRALEEKLEALKLKGKPEPEKTCQKCGGPFVCEDERRKHCFGCRRAPIVESECIVCGRVMEYHSYDADRDLCPMGIHLFTPRDEAARIIAKYKMEKKE